jgi:hypothetical protein
VNVQRLLLYLTSAILCLPLLSPAATNDTPQIAAQYHFAGAKRLAATTNLLTLNRIRALPSTAAFQKLVIDNVSAVLSARLGLAANAPAMSSPLLADLLPFFGQLAGFCRRTPVGHKPDPSLAGHFCQGAGRNSREIHRGRI